MAMAFDTLGYVRRLQEAGVDRKVAEAHADLAKDMILADPVTASDLDNRLTHLESQTWRMTDDPAHLARLHDPGER